MDISDQNYRRWVRNNFPSIRNLVYLASSGRAPMPAQATAAMKTIFEKEAKDVRTSIDEEKIFRDFSQQGAGLLCCKPEELAFVTSTTMGISLFGNAVKWKKGDNIVLCDVEYPSNIFPWVWISKREGVEIRKVKGKGGLISIKDIEKKVDDSTKVLPISLVQFASGQRMDIGHLSEICSDHGTMLFLDAIQALGAVKVDLRKNDIAGLAAGGYKWLCGPIGSGILQISDAWKDELEPAMISWLSLEKSQRKSLWSRIVTGGPLIDDNVNVVRDASAFSSLPECFVQMVGLTESVRFLRSIGITQIEKRIGKLNDYMLERLDENDFETITPADSGHRAGILAFYSRERMPNKKMADRISKELKNIKLVIRSGAFRSAAHFFNTKEDIDRALSALIACRNRGLFR